LGTLRCPKGRSYHYGRREATVFDTTLIASHPRREVRGKLATLPVALAIHVLAMGFVMAGQLWAVDGLPEPALVVSFVEFDPPMPPPPPPPRGKGPSAATNPPPVTSGVQPVEVPSEPARPVTPDAGGAPDGVPGGVPDGSADGVPGGVPREPDQPRVEPERIYRLDPALRPPIAVVRSAPAYPELARKLRREGVVVLEAVIDKSGGVVDARVLTDPGFGLSQAALAAVRTWRYQPATLDGRPVSVYLTVTVTFQLHGSP
jgi:protein TonB